MSLDLCCELCCCTLTWHRYATRLTPLKNSSNVESECCTALDTARLEDQVSSPKKLGECCTEGLHPCVTLLHVGSVCRVYSFILLLTNEACQQPRSSVGYSKCWHMDVGSLFVSCAASHTHYFCSARLMLINCSIHTV